MPCRDVGPGAMEQKFLLLERHIRWLESRLGMHLVGTHDLTLTRENLDYLTYVLCSTIGGMSEEQKDATIYNGRDPYAVKLADWWHTHQEMDRRRLEHENYEAEQQKLIESARNKLTVAEFEAVVKTRL